MALLAVVRLVEPLPQAGRRRPSGWSATARSSARRGRELTAVKRGATTAAWTPGAGRTRARRRSRDRRLRTSAQARTVQIDRHAVSWPTAAITRRPATSSSDRLAANQTRLRVSGSVTSQAVASELARGHATGARARRCSNPPRAGADARSPRRSTAASGRSTTRRPRRDRWRPAFAR